MFSLPSLFFAFSLLFVPWLVPPVFKTQTSRSMVILSPAKVNCLDFPFDIIRIPKVKDKIIILDMLKGRGSLLTYSIFSLHTLKWM